VLQWDLESADIPNSLEVIHTSNTLSAGALQLGIDRRIYRAQVEFSNFNNTGRFLGVINNPEANGLAANYQEQGVLLDISGNSQNLSRIGLPPFIQSLFNSQIDIIRNGESTTELKLCAGETYTLRADDLPGADYVWSFNGNPLPETGFELFVDTPGFYEVFIEPNNGDCPIEGSAVVGIFDIPVANPLTDVVFCDDLGNDGQATFDFTSKNAETLLAQDPNQFNVSYYESLADANNKENPITFPFVNTSNPQTIYVRVDNVDNATCFDVNSFQLEVFDTPEIVQNESIEFCDNLGDITDGIAQIDFNEIIPLVRGSQSETETAVSFHSNQADADANANPLPLLYTNTGAANETIFVRIENTLNPDCYSTDSFNLIVNSAPIANNASLFQCDEDGIPEGFTSFNLNEIVDDIIAGASNVSVNFYLSQMDADTNTNPVNADNFENFENPQLLFAKVTDNLTGCTNSSEVLLEVSATQTNNASLNACDNDGNEDGFTTFNLNDANDTILAGAPTGLEIAYYETYSDALLENNPLNSTFINTQAYNQTVYARVENANACFGISEIELTVFELPNIETELETLYCLNFFPETIVLNGGVIDDIPNNYLYDWSTGENTIEIEINEPGTYTVTVTNTNGCSKNRTITVVPSNIATVTDVEITDASDNNVVTVFVTGEGDYEYAIQGISGPYQDSNTFENLSPGIYTVYIRDKNNCGIVEEDVSVIGFPKFFTPNNDNYNDFWQIKGVSEQFQPNSKVFIFDRYGKLLKELNPLGPGWDGTYNGAKMPTSDYWFSVTLEDGRTFTSHFTLKR
jgi:gliding motility-associated-like protein